MAPLKPVRTNTAHTTITTRSKSICTQFKEIRGKRKAEGSPPKEPSLKRSAFGDVTNAISKNKLIENKKKVKKHKTHTIILLINYKYIFFFWKVANNLTTTTTILKKVSVQAKVLPSLKLANLKPIQKKALVKNTSVKTVVRPSHNENLAPPPAPALNPVATRIVSKNNTVLKPPKESLKDITNVGRIKTRLSNEFEKTEESLYSSALEDM